MRNLLPFLLLLAACARPWPEPEFPRGHPASPRAPAPPPPPSSEALRAEPAAPPPADDSHRHHRHHRAADAPQGGSR